MEGLEMVTRVGVETIVLVILKTLLPVGKNHFRVPKPDETSRISAIARILNPRIPIRMGCIRQLTPGRPRWRKVYSLWRQYHRLSLQGRLSTQKRLPPNKIHRDVLQFDY